MSGCYFYPAENDKAYLKESKGQFTPVTVISNLYKENLCHLW